MNFSGKWGALDQGVVYFWQVAVPITVFTLCVIASPYVIRLYKKSVKRLDEAGNARRRHPTRWKLSQKMASIQSEYTRNDQ